MKLPELIDLDEQRELYENLTALTGAATAILDLEGNILLATGWQDICTRFHRIHPETACRCMESDTILAGRLEKGDRYNVYKCKNGLVDVAVPITVGGEHVGNFFIGQFFFEPPDRKYFICQAEKFGFDKTAYLDALSRVPLFSEDRVRTMMDFFSCQVRIIGEMGLAKKRLQKANAALSKNEKKYRGIFENSIEGIFQSSMDGRLLNANPAMASILGYDSPDELLTIETAIRDKLYVHPQDHDVFLTSLRDRGTVSGYEVQLFRKDKGKIWAAVSAHTVRDDADTSFFIEGFLYDITQRKQAVEALRNSERRLTDIINFLPDATLVTDQEGKVIVWNRAIEEMTGVSAEDMVGKGDLEHAIPFYGTRRPILIDLVKKTAEEIEKDYSFITREKDILIAETEVPVVKGEKRVLWGKASLIHNGQGRIVGAIEAIRDVTERKQAEEELNAYRKRLEDLVKERTLALEEANTELSQYAYVVSHDLRAPLRAIHNYSDFLQEDLEETLDGDQKTYLDAIGRVVREAEVLIEDVLELSRVSRGIIHVEKVDMGTFIHRLIGLLTLPDNVEVKVASDWPLMVTEPVLLRQIFQNLIGNAVKFNTSHAKRVELGWRTVAEDTYEFFVRDNGIGIDPRYHEQIFRVFERLHAKEEYEGTGAGLAIVKKAAARLHGTVRVEAEAGKGSTFLVTLPGTYKENTP